MSYHEERLKLAEEIASLTERGFMAEVRKIADALSICPKEDVKTISEYLVLAVEAMASVDRDVAYYKEKVEAEKAVKI